MKKTIFFLLLLILPSCFSITEGQRLSQVEIDSLDTSTLGLNCRSDNVSVDLLNKKVIVEHSCLNVINDGGFPKPYLVVRSPFTVAEIYFKEILTVVRKVGVQKALEYYRGFLVNQNRGFRLEFLRSIEQLQTNHVPNNLPQLLTIPDENLNN